MTLEQYENKLKILLEKIINMTPTSIHREYLVWEIGEYRFSAWVYRKMNAIEFRGETKDRSIFHNRLEFTEEEEERFFKIKFALKDAYEKAFNSVMDDIDDTLKNSEKNYLNFLLNE